MPMTDFLPPQSRADERADMPLAPNWPSKYIYPASYNRRALAFSIDAIIIALILLPVVPIMVSLIYYGLDLQAIFASFAAEHTAEAPSLGVVLSYFTQHGLIWRFILLNTIELGLVASFIFYFWCRKSATPGKMITKCKVLDAHTGENISKKQALIRLCGYSLTFASLGLGFILMICTRKRQALHDWMAGTVVAAITPMPKGFSLIAPLYLFLRKIGDLLIKKVNK